MNSQKQIIYLGNNTTTKLDPRVLEAMMPYLTDEFGNAASNHEFGNNISQHVKEAREIITELIGCNDFEIFSESSSIY